MQRQSTHCDSMGRANNCDSPITIGEGEDDCEGGGKWISLIERVNEVN